MKPPYIDLVRPDLSNWLIHCTDSFESLQNILQEGRLRGSNNKILSGDDCICFSETPLWLIKKLLDAKEFLNKTANELVNESKESPIKYNYFGVMMKKDIFFIQGGRPVIYQEKDECGFLDKEKKYLHVTHELLENGVDFMWEREWRIKTKLFELDPDNIAVFVKSREYKNILLNNHYTNEQYMVIGYANIEEPYCFEIYPWHIITLEELF